MKVADPTKRTQSVRPNPLDRFNCGPVTFSGDSDALYERHLAFDQVARPPYANQEQWSRKAVLNIAASRTFSSDRTISEYAKEIWQAQACPVA